MKNYTIKIMAILNFNGKHSQVCLKEETSDNMEKGKFLRTIDIGRVQDFYVLDPGAKISIWIEEKEVEQEEVE